MDEQFVLNGISFVWNRAKARTNFIKHGIEFKQAAEAFFDPFIKLVDASSGTEERVAVIGMDNRWNLLFVVHIVLDNESIRIISARKATFNERQLYEN